MNHSNVLVIYCSYSAKWRTYKTSRVLTLDSASCGMELNRLTSSRNCRREGKAEKTNGSSWLMSLLSKRLKKYFKG